MPPQDSLEPLIAFIGMVAGALTSPLLGGLVFTLAVAARNPMILGSGVVALAAVETLLESVADSHPITWPWIAAGTLLATAVQTGVAVVLIDGWRALRARLRDKGISPPLP